MRTESLRRSLRKTVAVALAGAVALVGCRKEAEKPAESAAEKPAAAEETKPEAEPAPKLPYSVDDTRIASMTNEAYVAQLKDYNKGRTERLAKVARIAAELKAAYEAQPELDKAVADLEPVVADLNAKKKKGLPEDNPELFAKAKELEAALKARDDNRALTAKLEKDEKAAAKEAADYEREAKAFVMRQAQKDFHGNK